MKLIIQISLIFISFYGHSQINTDTNDKDSGSLDSVNHIYIPKNLEECFIQIDSFWHDTVKIAMKNLSEDEFSGRLHFGFGLWMRNNWGLWGGSLLANFFNEKGIYHPDDMSAIILDSYHRKLNSKPIKLEEQIKFYKEYWDKAKANELKKEQDIKTAAVKNLKWLNDRKIPILKLFKVDSQYIKMTCDSDLVIKTINKDSIFLWTTGSESYYGDNHPFGYKYLEAGIKNKQYNFGKLSYIKGLNYQGNITLVTLKKHVFKISKDSLFELEEFYKISNDSVAKLNKKIYNFEGNKRERKKSLKILSTNLYYKFKLIYCKSMFRDNKDIYYNPDSRDSISLTGYWEIESKKYYKISIENKTEDGTKTSYRYRFDELFRFVDYEGCDKAELEALSTDNNLIKSEDD